MSIPFRVGEHVTGEYFTDRAREVKKILRAMREPTRLLVYGERRQGKSSAIRFAAERFDGLAPWVDVATVSSFAEIARRLVASVPYAWVWREELQARLLRAALQVELRGDPAGNPVLSLGIEPRPVSPEHGKDELRRVIGVLDDLAAEGGPALALVLDEFQQITELVDEGGWFLRELMQNAHHLSFVCAGSRTALIQELLAESGPFHRFFEPLNVRRIDPEHLATWIEDRMRSAGVDPGEGVGSEILRAVGPRTQDCLQLARAVFGRRQGDGAASRDDVAAALRESVFEDADRFEKTWSDLAPSQHAVLRAVAAGEKHLYGQDAARRHGLPTSGAIRRAILALRDKGHLTEDDRPRIDDPFFREWIRRSAMPDGGALAEGGS